MKKRKEKSFAEQYDEEYAIVDAILLAFNKNLYYDYPIPDESEIRDCVFKLIDEKRIPIKLHKKIQEVICSPNNGYSKMFGYMSDTIRFGCEWFYGFGTVYRWRQGERDRAVARVKKYLSRNMKDVKIMQEELAKVEWKKFNVE